MALLRDFPPPERVAVPGFITDFLGQRTRSTTIGQPPDPHGRALDPPVPLDFHADVVEWVAFIKALKAARGQFVMAELGAGWGPWTAAAHHLARRLGLARLRLHAVEADAGHFGRMRQHLADNGVPDDILSLRHAAVTEGAGDQLWPSRHSAGADYGARPVSVGGGDYRGYVPDGQVDRKWPSLEAMTLADGVQLWRNPRLAA